LYDAIVWLDKWTQEISDKLIDELGVDYFRPITGLPINTYFSAVKILWLLQNVESVQKAKEKGTLRFGTIDSWILFKLTNG